MEILLAVNDILIYKEDGKYYIRYDSGGSVSRMMVMEVSESDAKQAAKSELAADKIIMHYENMAMYGEDYLDRRKQKP